MRTMESQITSLTFVYSNVDSGADKQKTSKLRVTGLCAGNSPVTGEFPTQKATHVENDLIWWRHHASKPIIQNFSLNIFCELLSATEPHYWKVDIGSDNDWQQTINRANGDPNLGHTDLNDK